MEKIVKVEIRPATSLLGNKAAYVWLEDEGIPTRSGIAFVWFDDQVFINESELIGLTLEEAHKLRHSKHLAKHNRVILSDI